MLRTSLNHARKRETLPSTMHPSPSPNFFYIIQKYLTPTPHPKVINDRFHKRISFCPLQVHAALVLYILVLVYTVYIHVQCTRTLNLT